ncbi:MAG: FtsH protease activity modulator HflK [Oscillospiraceae bacterium]|nr:FtsH protease activity modulator HflK [Oscillospiraceae bacterium]
MNERNPFGSNFNFNVRKPDMKKFQKKANRVILVIVGIIALVVLAANGVYSVNSGEEAVVTRFGRHIGTEKTPGLKFKIPFVDNAHIVNVQGVRRMDFGSQLINGVYVDIPEEALMLTGEESRVNGLVNADWVIQFRISDSYNYLFKVDNPEATLHSVTQAAYRRVVAAYPLEAILTDRKEDMQREIMRDLQEILNKYEMGILITAVQLQDASPPHEVRDAFLDVTMSLEDKIAKTNEAERYRNEEIPRAEGRAVAAINEAEAYTEKRVNDAMGTVARYSAIELEYRNQPDVMRTRLYLEMIREVMPKIDKVYFLDSTSGNLLEILHLGQGGQ